LVGVSVRLGSRLEGFNMMVSDEPANLREWIAPANSQGGGRLFTCGRPGRATFGPEKRAIADDVIDAWVKGLPQAEVLDIVSLLGKKTSGFSEFGYYLLLARHGPDAFHVLFAADVEGDNVRVVTSYRPDLAEWEPDFKARRPRR
jgi:hypothetical protein